MFELLGAAERPIAIVGGAGWTPTPRRGFHASSPSGSGLPGRERLPAAGCDPDSFAGLGRQSRLWPQSRSWSSGSSDADLLLRRRRAARRGDHRWLYADHARPSRPDTDPRPSRSQRAQPRLSHRSARSARDTFEFAETARRAAERSQDRPAFDGAARRMPNGSNGPRPSRAKASTLDLGQCVAAMRERCRRTRSSATARAISRAGGTAIGATARSLAARARPPGRWAMACPPRSPASCARPNGQVARAGGRRRFPDERTGTGHRGPARRRHASCW